MRRFYLGLVTFLIFSSLAYAHSGCCSSHGGVCGCACCDGSPLSTTCLPYYPQCGGGGGGGGSFPAPSSLGGSPISSTSCVLSWADNSTGEDSFQIEERVGSQTSYLMVDTVSANITMATISHLSPATSYSFRVRAHGQGSVSDYSDETTITTFPDVSTLCQAPALCFNQDRFSVVAQWKTSDGRSGTGTVVRLTEDSGYFWFFDPTNVELVFKVLDACTFSRPNYWFYAGGLTNVQVTITVTDSKTGATQTYSNPLNKPFQPIQDSAAFATCP